VMRESDDQAAIDLAESLNMSVMSSRILLCRGISDPVTARVFLGNDLAGLIDPFQMRDMNAAVDSVEGALDSKARIRVYGDYDVDGVCATALLVRALRGVGGHVDWHIPHRLDEGYGLNEDAIRQAHAQGVSLLITVDCGSTAIAPISLARELGMDVVVTDHHRPGTELPDAPVLNPVRADCDYPFTDLAGVGVAFKLVSAIARRRNIPPDRELNFLDLVCLGTVADVVPLIGENRLFVQHGLPRLAASKKTGILALMEVAGVGRNGTPGVRDVAFGLAPRINAAGRMEDARAAVNLLLARDRARARELAAELSEHNAARRAEEQRTLKKAESMVIRERDLASEKVLVLGSEGWHPGVIGIVASRLVERHHRPTLLVAIADGVGKGSGRSISGFNLWEHLRECTDLLERFGGHRYAAGFTIHPKNLDRFRLRMNDLADGSLTADDLVRSIDIDAEVGFRDLTIETISELERLSPFGVGNPTPVLVTRGMQLAEARRVGDGSHVSVRVRGDGRGEQTGIWFGAGELGEGLVVGNKIDMCYRARVEDWRGELRVKLVVEDIAVWDND